VASFSGNYNTDFQNTTAYQFRYNGDTAGGTNNPGGTWWFQENFRHSNSSNYWGTQVAWGWEDNANRLATRNVSGNSFGGWVYYLNSNNYNSYAPTLTGTGASGTWGISVTGNAATVTGGITTSNYTTYTVKRTGNIGNGDLNSATYYTGSQVLGYNTATNRPGGEYGTMISINERGDTCLQIVVDYSSGYLFSRGIYTGGPTYSAWRTYLNNDNYTTYAPSLTGTGASGTWAISISGTAATATSAPNYLPLAGGTMTGPMYTSSYDNSSKVMFNSASTYYLGLTGNVATGGGSLSMVQYSSPSGTAATAVNSYPLLHSNNYTTYAMPSGSSATNSVDVRAPYFYDSNNTAFYADLASTTNINTLSGNGKTIFTTGDSYLRLNEGSGFVNGTWFGGSLIQATGIYAGSNGGTTTSRVAITGGTYNGGNVITLDGSTGRITATESMRSPIFYDSNDTTYYIDPATFTNVYGGMRNSGAHGSSTFDNRLLAANNGASTGEVLLRMWCSEPGITWDGAGFGYNVYNDGGANGFGKANASFGQAYMRMTSDGNWYFYNVTTGGTRYTTMQFVNTGYAIAFQSMRSPIFYDQDNTGYYVDANSTSRMGTINADVLYSYGNVTAYSDERLKKDWEKLPSNFVEELAKIKSGTYTRIDSGERQVGVGAQSLQAILKEAVSEKEEYLGVHYGNAAMVSAVELAKEVVDLRARVAILESLISKLIEI
jgi:hypothetical protein